MAKIKEQSALHHASAANHDTSAGEREDQDAESSDSAAAFSASAFQHRGSSADIELKHNTYFNTNLTLNPSRGRPWFYLYFGSIQNNKVPHYIRGSLFYWYSSVF